MTSRDIAELVELAEAAALADVLRAAPAHHGFWVDQSDAAVALFAPGVDLLMFNRVIGLGVRESASRSIVEGFAVQYRELGVQNFGVQLSPEAQPAALADWLVACDLRLRDYWTKVYRPTATDVGVATDLRIEAIDSSLADCFGDVACEGFGMPPSMGPVWAATVGRPNWRHYLAWDGDRAAATAALFVVNSIGWLGVAATLPAYRRRGAQGALMARRLRDGAALGCRWFTSETGQDRPDKPNPSFRNMLRAGFIIAYHRPNFMPPKA